MSSLVQKYPPSAPCSCNICLAYCSRPGWWTVDEAKSAVDSGYANRMMLEMSPDFTFGVLSPAFKGAESGFATRIHASNGCTFLTKGLCELHDRGMMPLECRFCHHNRAGKGTDCHNDLEKDWMTPAGQEIVAIWSKLVKLWERYPSSK